MPVHYVEFPEVPLPLYLIPRITEMPRSEYTACWCFHGANITFMPSGVVHKGPLTYRIVGENGFVEQLLEYVQKNYNIAESFRKFTKKFQQ